MQRTLITLGLSILMVGLLWPWISKLGLGRLPGDVTFARGNFRFYFPLGTSLLISLLLTLVVWLLRK